MDFAPESIQEYPPLGAAGTQVKRGPLHAYLLEDAEVHGPYGVITCGGKAVGATTAHLPVHAIAGAAWLSADRLRLPRQRRGDPVDAALHLCAANSANYFHWMFDGLSRFQAADARGYGAFCGHGVRYRPLVNPRETSWQRDSLALLLPDDVEPLEIPAGVSIQVRRLIYIEQYAYAGCWGPHKALSAVFGSMRARALQATSRTGKRPGRIFVSRADSANRKLENEAELAECALSFGFERVVLSDFTVAEQIRLFAGATHIVAPHGAGLANLVFCRPGAAICELQMSSYVHWAFRGLAALQQMRYGCLLGAPVGPHHDWIHKNAWRLDVQSLAGLLADPAFTGAP